MALKKAAKKVASEKQVGGFMSKIMDRANAQKEYVRKVVGEDRTIYVGDPVLDWATGGFKRGRSNLFFGPSRSGKSTIALKIAAIEQQKSGGLVLIYDSEYANDMTDPDVLFRWKQAGLDPEKTVSVSSNEVDQLFFGLGDLEADLKESKAMIMAGKEPKLKVSAIIVDSWGGIESEQAKDKINNDNISGAGNQYGGNAKTINPILQTLLRIGAEYNITVVFVQHCIENMDKHPATGQPIGPKWILLGGQKLRFLCNGITFLESVESGDSLINAAGEAIRDVGGVAVGKKIRVRCEKSRQQVEGRKADMWFNFTDFSFVNRGLSLFNLASNLEVISHPHFPEKDKKGKPVLDDKGKPVTKENVQWWSYGDKKFHGTSAMVAALDTDKELYDAVYKGCMECGRNDAINGAKVGSEEGLGSDREESEEEIKSLAEVANAGE